MRDIHPGLQAHLDGGATTLCHCWQIDRRDGVRFGFTDHDRALSFDGVTFEPDTGLDGAALQSSADLGVDNSEIEGALTSDRLSSIDLAAGRYDGAEILIWRVNWREPVQRVLLKKGIVGEVVRENNRFRAELRGLSHHLGRTVGRVYQRQCDANIGDGRCGVDLDQAVFRGSGTVTQILDGERFIVSGLEQFDATWFAHGLLTWVSGANASLSVHVKSHELNVNGASIALWLPSGAPIETGDQFDITAGCDKRNETCAAKFSNLINFRGFHLMPGNDFIISYPSRTDDNDGGRR